MSRHLGIESIFLDFDGVIVESVNIKTQAFRELFSQYPEKIEDIVNYHLDNNAQSRYVKFKYICESILGEEYSESYEKKLDSELSRIVFNRIVSCPEVSGAIEFLDYFVQHVPLFLISASPYQELNKILLFRDLQKYFRGIFGSPGRKIDHIQQIIAQESFHPGNIIYIGDMQEDYRISKQSGMIFIGREGEESLEGIPSPVFPDMKKISDYIIETYDL